jgi:hypothetical protein
LDGGAGSVLSQVLYDNCHLTHSAAVRHRLDVEAAFVSLTPVAAAPMFLHIVDRRPEEMDE